VSSHSREETNKAFVELRKVYNKYAEEKDKQGLPEEAIKYYEKCLEVGEG